MNSLPDKFGSITCFRDHLFISEDYSDNNGLKYHTRLPTQTQFQDLRRKTYIEIILDKQVTVS